MPHVLKIMRDNEDHIEFYLDGKFIQQVNHDCHGYIGMEAVEDALLAVAETMKWAVVSEEMYPDEEDENEEVD